MNTNRLDIVMAMQARAEANASAQAAKGQTSMSSDSRTVATDALETLGTIINEHQKRDAIHLAVLPMLATVRLFPGQDVGIVPGGAGPCEKPLGIVDPFLKAPVQYGEWFWLVLYPRTIASLRHVWSHPAVDNEPEQAAFVAPSVANPKSESEKWLRAFAEKIGLSYDMAINAMRNGEHGDYHVFDYDTPGECYRDVEEMWKHYEIVTGKTVEDKEHVPFSCTC